MVWVVFDANRIGLCYQWGVLFILFSYLGVSLAFPVYLVVRERHLDKSYGPESLPRVSTDLS